MDADGRIVFAHQTLATRPRDGSGLQWDPWWLRLQARGLAAPLPTDTADSETHPRVSPDGRRVVYVGSRFDRRRRSWAMPVPAASVAKPVPLGARPPAPPTPLPVRRLQTPGPQQHQARSRAGRRGGAVTRARGDESSPSWAPDNERIAFTPCATVSVRVGGHCRAAAARATSLPCRGRNRPPPSSPPGWAAHRHGRPMAACCSSPACRNRSPSTTAIRCGTKRSRHRSSRPPRVSVVARAGATTGSRRWRHVDHDLAPIPTLCAAAFRAHGKRFAICAYSAGSSAEAWLRLRDTYQPRAANARNEADLEDAIDAMIAEQPLIKPDVSPPARRRLGTPAGVQAGRMALDKGGNVVG